MVFNRFVDCAIVADSDTAVTESIVPVRPLFCASYPTCSPTLRYDRCSSVADNSWLESALLPFDETQTKSWPLLQACPLLKLLVGYFLAVICLLGLLAPECVVYVLSLLGLFFRGARALAQ